MIAIPRGLVQCGLKPLFRPHVPMTSPAAPQPVDEPMSECPRRAAIRRIREDLRRIVPAGVSLADELIADRRAEAAREEAEASGPG